MAHTRLIATQALAAIVAATLSAAAGAQDIRQYRATEHVDPRDVARILGTPAQAPKMRSLRILGDTTAARVDSIPIEGVSPSESVPPTPNALALPVQFGFDSANILPQARPQLDALAIGIKLLPADQLVVIEGHTDAVGAEHYNLQLSTRRAVAVKEYLMRMHGIDSGRLATEGYGKFRPINADDGRAAENRRVQFRGG
jgi:outer membrane protein OmpA-like peptidoglycan-associated protein